MDVHVLQLASSLAIDLLFDSFFFEREQAGVLPFMY